MVLIALLILLVILLSVLVFYLFFVIEMLIDVAGQTFDNPNYKYIWIAIIALTGIGALLYYFRIKRHEAV